MTDIQARFRLLESIAGNDSAALDFLNIIGGIARDADDLADGDAQSPDYAAYYLMMNLLDGLRQNSFFLEHENILQPVLMETLTNWHLSNKWHTSADRERQTWAYVKRHSTETIAMHVAAIQHGWGAVPTIMETVMDVLRDGETLDDWIKEGQTNVSQNTQAA